jgi:crotonobetainyl-CoA:carnitine CoA-transferase CaiB-like acyl-CoA transferase
VTPTDGQPLARFSVLDLTTVRSGPAAWGPHKVLALLVHLARTPAIVERAAPMTGEHTHEVLATLGYDAATLDALVAEGVIEQHKGETK